MPALANIDLLIIHWNPEYLRTPFANISIKFVLSHLYTNSLKFSIQINKTPYQKESSVLFHSIRFRVFLWKSYLTYYYY